MTTAAPLRVLGIDPGLTRCGYAVIEARGSRQFIALALGVIRTPPTDALPQRLAALKLELAALIAEFQPHAVAVEQVFFQVNVRTAMSVGQASGLALAEAAAAGCDVMQYTPNQVKNAVAGYGGADKLQVQKMVQQRLGLSPPQCLFARRSWAPSWSSLRALSPRWQALLSFTKAAVAAALMAARSPPRSPCPCA